MHYPKINHIILEHEEESLVFLKSHNLTDTLCSLIIGISLNLLHISLSLIKSTNLFLWLSYKFN